MNEQVKQCIEEVNAVLLKNDCRIDGKITIVGNQIVSEIIISKRPEEEKKSTTRKVYEKILPKKSRKSS